MTCGYWTCSPEWAAYEERDLLDVAMKRTLARQQLDKALDEPTLIALVDLATAAHDLVRAQGDRLDDGDVGSRLIERVATLFPRGEED